MAAVCLTGFGTAPIVCQNMLFVQGRITSTFQEHWFTRGFSNYSQTCCQLCIICAKHNVGRGVPTTQAAYPPPDEPDDHLQMDFIEPTPVREKIYSLVVVGMFSKWVEVLPTSKEDSSAVSEALIREIIFRDGESKLKSAVIMADHLSVLHLHKLVNILALIFTNTTQCLSASQWRCCREKERHPKKDTGKIFC